MPIGIEILYNPAGALDRGPRRVKKIAKFLVFCTPGLRRFFANFKKSFLSSEKSNGAAGALASRVFDFKHLEIILHKYVID